MVGEVVVHSNPRCSRVLHHSHVVVVSCCFLEDTVGEHEPHSGRSGVGAAVDVQFAVAAGGGFWYCD